VDKATLKNLCTKRTLQSSGRIGQAVFNNEIQAIVPRAKRWRKSNNMTIDFKAFREDIKEGGESLSFLFMAIYVYHIMCFLCGILFLLPFFLPLIPMMRFIP
jgi:hypothetical protein